MNTPTATLETRTVAAAMAGDRACFDALMTPWRPRLVAALRGRVAGHADAEDVAQQAMLRAWEKRETFDTSRPLGPWLLTIAYRLAADTRRAAGRRTRHESDAGHDAGRATAWSHPAAESSDTGDAVWRAVRETLEGDAWTVVWLVYREGQSVKDAAAVIGKSAGATRVLLHRARAKLAGPLADFDGDAL